MSHKRIPSTIFVLLGNLSQQFGEGDEVPVHLAQLPSPRAPLSSFTCILFAHTMFVVVLPLGAWV